MKSLLRIVLPVLGLLLIGLAIVGGPGSGRGSIDFLVTLALGFTFIVSPFLALGIALMYFLMLMFIVGAPFLGAYLGAQLGGRDSLAVWVGLLAGGYIGMKFVLSDGFDVLMRPIRKLADQDGKQK